MTPGGFSCPQCNHWISTHEWVDGNFTEKKPSPWECDFCGAIVGLVDRKIGFGKEIKVLKIGTKRDTSMVLDKVTKTHVTERVASGKKLSEQREKLGSRKERRRAKFAKAKMLEKERRNAT